jgi:cation/acetate symporter
LITDGRFSGGTWGFCIGHVAPEAVDGGPIAFVRDGDQIKIDVANFGLDLLVDEAELAKRREGWKPNPPRYTSGVLGKYAKLAQGAEKGAITNLIPNPADYFVNGELAKGLKGGGNMAAVHLAKAVGGDLFMGFISAVAFATILAVVAGLTLSGASAVSHDLYASVWRKGRVDQAQELRVSKITTVCLGIVAVVLGIAFEKENVAYMVMLAFVIAASANFPVLFMSVLWKGTTTKGAVTGGFVGLVTAVTLTIGSASVWEAVMMYPKGSAWFPYQSAAIFSIPAAFITIWLVSLLDRSARGDQDRAGFPAQQVRSETGIGASTGSGH